MRMLPGLAAAVLALSLLAVSAGAETTAEPAGGVVVGDTERRQPHFSAAFGQGDSHPSYLAPRFQIRAPGVGSHGDPSCGYPRQRNYEAHRYLDLRD